MRKLWNYWHFIIINNIRIGSYFIVTTWSVFQITGLTSEVGKLFLINSLITLFSSPLLGVFIDRKTKTFALLIGQALIVIGISIPSSLFLSNIHLNSLLALYTMITLVTLGNTITINALEGLLQVIVPNDKFNNVKAIQEALQQFSLIIGSVITGNLIYIYGLAITFIVLTLLSLYSFIILGLGLLPISQTRISQTSNKNSFRNEMNLGFYYFFKSPLILIFSIGPPLSFTVAQLMNVFLPEYIGKVIQGSSQSYSIIQASWSFGALLISIIFILFLHRFSFHKLEFLSITCLGITTVLFGYIKSIAGLMVLCTIMGISFCINKVLCEAHLLKICPPTIIGRVKSISISIASLFGIIIYLLPIILKNINICNVYKISGLTLIALGIMLNWFCRICSREDNLR